MKRSILKVVLSTALLTSVGFSNELVLSGTKVKFSKKLSLNQLQSTSLEQSDLTFVIHTKESLSKKEKDKLYQDGVKVVEYAGINSYYLVSSKDTIESIVENSDFIQEIAVLKPEHKINQDLKNVNINDEIKVKLTLLGELSSERLEMLLEKNGIPFKDLSVDGGFRSAQLTIMGVDVEKVASLALVQEIRKYHKVGLIKPFSADLSTTDLDTIEKTNADVAKTNNTGLDGLNIPVAVVDEGKILSSHKEFKVGDATRIRDRVINGGLSNHSTHVAGIIGAKGENQYAVGMAESTQIFSFSFQDLYFADSISTLVSRFDIKVSNHSYGFSDKVDLGVYNSDASSEDSLVYNNPYINVFMAAGNDRAYGDYPEVGIIKGAANAKNIFTIGALNFNSDNVAYYSSTGPVRDYRIKPDLCVKGTSVLSTGSSGGYVSMSGTSMATPAATGLATLVMQEYKNITDCGGGKGCDMRHDLLKAVLINTAVDKNSTGPDIYTGYGMIDVSKAVETIKTIEDDKKEVKMDEVYQGRVKEYSFSTSSQSDLNVTISWIDPKGNGSSSGKSLVNDVDMYLLDVDNDIKYYPYSLNKEDVTAPALHDRRNDVDTTEKIEVSNLPAGNYKLVVSGNNIQSSKQRFAIASNIAIFDTFSSIVDDNNQPEISIKEPLEVNNFAKVMLDSIY